MSTAKIFTIRRAYSNGLFTIRVCDRQSVIAFKSKKNASRFIAIEKMMVGGKPQQPLCIDHISLQSLQRRCSLNALTLTLYDDQAEYTVYEEINNNLDEMQFHFENVLKYFDP